MSLVDILIVDDREDGLVALEAVLSKLSNIKVVRAQSGSEALSLLPRYEFAVILLDVQMPGMDGFEAARQIRLREDYRNTPIIFVTAINKDDEHIYKGYQAGAVDYIFKPFEPQILRSKVSIFIDLFLKNKQLQEQNELIRESEKRERNLELARYEVNSLKRYRNLANAIPHIVWQAKIDGSIDYFNQMWTQTTGRTLEQSLGSAWQEAIYSPDLSLFLKAWLQAMTEKNAFEIECRIRKLNGELRWHWIRSVPEMRGDEIVAWLGTGTDIHERKLNADKLVKAQEAAEAANQSKTAFLANMSHEIRTPLASILGFAEMMLDPNQAKDQRERCISTIRRSGQQLLTIINEILDISKVEAGHLELELIPVHIGSLLAELHLLLSVQAQGKGLDLRFQFDSSIPELVITDPNRFRQILLNIIGNAIKFTEKGSISVNISWNKKDQDSSGIRIRVIDNGVGISEAQRKRLFQQFMQADSSTTRKFGGTGLGLALSQKLAQALGGDISLQSSEVGWGSTFLIEIPLKIVSETAWMEEMPSVHHDEEMPVKIDPASLKGVEVLAVDDSPDNLAILRVFLESAGAKVDFSSNGEEAIKKVTSKYYDIVLMDIQMPHMDGYEATKRLRSQGYDRPIIALTAYALKEERNRCLQAGCSDHMTKPIDRRKLMSQIAKFVGRPDLKDMPLSH